MLGCHTNWRKNQLFRIFICKNAINLSHFKSGRSRRVKNKSHINNNKKPNQKTLYNLWQKPDWRQKSDVFGIIGKESYMSCCETTQSGFYCQQVKRSHTYLPNQQKFRELGWKILMHPVYSSDLAPLNYHMFRSLEEFVDGINSMEDAKMTGHNISPKNYKCPAVFFNFFNYLIFSIKRIHTFWINPVFRKALLSIQRCS